MSNTITAYFKGRVGVAESVYQNDYGLVMAFDGIWLPAHFDCYFSKVNQDGTTPAVGSDNRVAIPNSILADPGNMTIHIPLHEGSSDSEVEYVVYFKVIGRARPEDDGTPAQMTAIEQALALLQSPITNIEEIVNEALSFTGDTFQDMKADLQEDYDNFSEAVSGDVADFKTEVRGRVSDVESDFSDLASDFDNLEAQFDTAVAAVTTDTEVTNIRVGDDNLTYTTAGESVRKQFANVKKDLTEAGFFGTVALDTSDLAVGYVNKYGTYNGDTGWHYLEVDVTEGQKYKISAQSYIAVAMCVFKDSSNNVVGYYPAAETSSVTNYEDVIITAPTNAAKMFVNKYLSRTFKVERITVKTPLFETDKSLSVTDLPADAKSTGDLFELLLSSAPEAVDTSSMNSGYVNRSGALVSDSGWTHFTASVSEGDKFAITAQSWLAIPMVAFLDSSNNVVKCYPTSEDSSITTHIEEEIVAPANAATMHVNRYLSRSFIVEEYKTIAASPYKSIKVGIIGDSWSDDTESEMSTIKYTHLLHRYDNITIDNVAVSGHGYKRADDNDDAFYQQALKLSSDCDIVFVFGSFNDLGKVISGEYTIGEDVDNASTSTNTIMECINMTIKNARATAPKAKVIIASPAPWGSYHPGGGQYKQHAENYVAAIKKVAENQCCYYIDMFHHSNMLPWYSAFASVYYNSDGVHPKNAGQRYFYPLIRDAINANREIASV